MLTQIGDFQTLLFHRVPVTQRDCVEQSRISLAQRFEIHGYAKWRANFVLTPITPANCTAFVIKHMHVYAEKIDNVFRFGDKLWIVLKQWKNREFDRRHARMK